MITTDKVTEIFCILDEFCKNLDAELTKNRLSGRLVGTNYFYYFCTMELFKQLASLMLPSQILDYFDVVKVEEGATQIEISLDETYPESDNRPHRRGL